MNGMKNGKYYVACSSFQYFPGVPILESGDLVNWKQIRCFLFVEVSPKRKDGFSRM
jgi:beta-xylosidase